LDTAKLKSTKLCSPRSCKAAVSIIPRLIFMQYEYCATCTQWLFWRVNSFITHLRSTPAMTRVRVGSCESSWKAGFTAPSAAAAMQAFRCVPGMCEGGGPEHTVVAGGIASRCAHWLCRPAWPGSPRAKGTEQLGTCANVWGPKHDQRACGAAPLLLLMVGSAPSTPLSQPVPNTKAPVPSTSLPAELSLISAKVVALGIIPMGCLSSWLPPLVHLSPQP